MSQRIVSQVATEFEAQSLNAVVAGFSFAAALSWMDLVRWATHQIVKVNKNSGMNYAITAIVTTFLSIIVYMLLSRASKRVVKPVAPIYAVSR